MKELKFKFLLILIVISSLSVKANVVVLNGLTHVHNGQKGTQVKGEIVLQNVTLCRLHLFTF